MFLSHVTTRHNTTQHPTPALSGMADTNPVSDDVEVEALQTRANGVLRECAQYISDYGVRNADTERLNGLVGQLNDHIRTYRVVVENITTIKNDISFRQRELGSVKIAMEQKQAEAFKLCDTLERKIAEVKTLEGGIHIRADRLAKAHTAKLENDIKQKVIDLERENQTLRGSLLESEAMLQGLQSENKVLLEQNATV